MSLSYFWKKKTILSFLLIILVIVIHNSATFQYDVPSDTVSDATYFIHNFFAYGLGGIVIPFFFLVSGIAFFRNYNSKLYTKKLRSRVKTLLIPYLFWNIFGLIFAIIYTYTPLSSFVSGREFFTPSFQNIFEGIFYYKYNFQFWFLYDLIFYVLITPLIHLIIKQKQVGLIFCILSLFLPLLTESFIGINTSFTVFYLIGCYIGKHYLSVFTKPSNKKFLLLSVFSAIIILIVRMLSIYNILNYHQIITQILNIILLFNVWVISDCFIAKIKRVPKIMPEFFPVYALHTYFLMIIIKVFYLILPENSISLLINELGSTTITTLITTLVAVLWHSKLPKTYNFVFGGNRKKRIKSC